MMTRRYTSIVRGSSCAFRFAALAALGDCGGSESAPDPAQQARSVVPTTARAQATIARFRRDFTLPTAGPKPGAHASPRPAIPPSTVERFEREGERVFASL